MTKNYTSLFHILVLISVMLTGCATNPTLLPEVSSHIISSAQRNQQLQAIKKWRLTGKIAFIQQSKDNNKRESASINWQVNDNQKTQELNLTSYLGINVLHLKSNKTQHLIKVDGKEYKGTNLANLIYSLTGLTLPTDALSFWLKGLPYNTDDQLHIDDTTQLPISLSSHYHNALWQIKYSNYQRFNHISMATKFTIKKDNLLIKVAVKNWSFPD